MSREYRVLQVDVFRDRGPSGRDESSRLPELADRIKNMRVYVYAPGRTVFEQGGVADAAYVIDEGVVKVSRSQPDGRVALIGLRTRGWILGLASVLLDEPHATATETLTPCTLRLLPADEFRTLLREDQEISWHVHQLLSRQVYDQTVKISWFSCLSARHRLECLLSDLVTSQPSLKVAGEIRVPATLKHWEMAQAIGVDATYLSRLLNALERDGVLRRTKGWLVICAPEKLVRHSR